MAAMARWLAERDKGALSQAPQRADFAATDDAAGAAFPTEAGCVVGAATRARARESAPTRGAGRRRLTQKRMRVRLRV
jgi:hypothetical protein